MHPTAADEATYVEVNPGATLPVRFLRERAFSRLQRRAGVNGISKRRQKLPARGSVIAEKEALARVHRPRLGTVQ